MNRLQLAVQLARRIVLHDRDRLAKAIGAIAFALLLILVQLGFRSALVDSAIVLLDKLNADVIVLARNKDSVLEREVISRDRLYQVRAVPGVTASYPLHIDAVLWKHPRTGTLRPIRLIGFDPDDPVFLDEEINAQAHLLHRMETVLFDRKSRDYFGYDGSGSGEVSRRRVDVVGTVDIGTDFELDGNIIAGEATYFRIAPGMSNRHLEMVLATVAAGVDADVVAAQMNEILPPEAEAWSKAALRAREQHHWATATPVGIIFLVGTAVGFIAGIIILYQVLFALINDHLAEFAMMKAIGYDAVFLILVVLAMALTLTLIGLAGSLLVSTGLYRLIAWQTGLPIAATMGRALTVSVLAVAMGGAAGVLALRKVLKLDPAEVFK